MKTPCAIIRASIIASPTKDLFPDESLRTWPCNVPAVDMPLARLSRTIEKQKTCFTFPILALEE